MRAFALLCCVATLSLGACATGNINTAFRTSDLNHGSSAFIDAKQRAILSGVRPDTGASVLCAEPGPDVFSAGGSAIGANASGDGYSAGFAGSTSEAAGAVSAPTTAILAQRHAYFRICEAYMNGASDDIDVVLGIRNNQRSLAGIIAIEQLTGAVRAPSTVLSASGSASTGQLLSQLSASRSTEVARRQQAQGRVTSLTHERDALQTQETDVETQLKQSGLSDAQTTDLTNRKATLLQQIANKNTEVTDATASVAASDSIVQSLDTAIAAAHEGGAATTSTGFVINNGGSNISAQTAKDLADAVVQIVRTTNSTDYGPSECLDILRRTLTGEAQPLAENPLPSTMVVSTNGAQSTRRSTQWRGSSEAVAACRNVLIQYTAGLAAQVNTQTSIAQAIARLSDAATRRQLTDHEADALAALISAANAQQGILTTR